MVVQPRQLHFAPPIQDRLGTQVDVRRNELFDQIAQRVRVGQRGDLVVELELRQDFLDVRREPVEVRLEIGAELLGVVEQAFQREGRGVVERLARLLAQSRVLVGDLGRVEVLLHAQHLLLGAFQQGIQPPDHRHRQNHVPILAPDIHVAQHVVRDPPDEADDAVVLRVVHSTNPSCRAPPSGSPVHASIAAGVFISTKI